MASLIGGQEPLSLRLLFVGLWLVVCVLVVPPLYFLVQASFYSWSGVQRSELSLENYEALLSSNQTWELVANSLIYALGSAAVALLLGTALAWLVERSNAPMRAAVYVGVFANFAIPGITQVIGWILLLGPRAGYLNLLLERVLDSNAPTFDIFSMQGMILIEGLGWAPVVFLLLATPFQSMDPSLEEAANMAGAGPWQTFRRVTFRLAWPSVLAALLLSFIRAVEAFEVPALIGIPGGIRVMTTQIYLQLRSGMLPQYGRASAYAVLLLAMVASLLYVYTRQTQAAKKFATITGKGFQPRRVDLGVWRWPAAALCVLLPASVILPVFILVWASFLPFYIAPSLDAVNMMSLLNYERVLQNSSIVSSLSNTVVVGATAATFGMVVTLLVAWFAVRTTLPGRYSLDGLTSLPLVIPGIVAGVAILRTYINVPFGIYGSIWILAIAYAMRTLPFGMRFAHAGLLQIHSDLEESAQVSGAPLRVRLWRIVLPLMVPAFFAGWIYIFLFSIRALSMAVILSGPRNEVVAVTILNLWENGQVTVLSALSVVVTVVAVGLSLVFYAVSRRYGLRT